MDDRYKLVCGIPFSLDENDLMVHLQLFLRAPDLQKSGEAWIRGQPFVYTGEGRAEHSRIISRILWPKAFEWHDWSTLIDENACEHPRLAITGCGASSKSTTIGAYALKFWMAAPTETAVILASKTIESAKRRIWKYVARYYGLFSQLVHGYKDAVVGSSPRPYISPILGADRKKDEAHGLYVVAMHGKELEKEIGYIKGFHPTRILVIADEFDVLEDGGHALADTFDDNLKTGTYESQIIVLGNDPSLFNALGDAMQPEIGKPVGLAQKEWTSAKGWRCLRLDAWDSPRIKNPKLQGLVTQGDIDDLVSRKGENSPSVWIQLHGLHPPEGSANTVLSEATLIRFHAFDKVIWKTDFTVSASLDPAFGGGDACCFRTFKRGNDTDGNLKILCDEVIEIPVSANDETNPAEYQIADKVKNLCKTRGIAPDEFVVGSTGIGRGVGAVLQREWSPRIQIVDENGSPSDLIVSNENPRPAKELYDRRVTELWFSVREFVEADMIRGLDRTTANQLCSRTYEDKGSGGSRKDSIQKKDEMLHSPNEADALAFYIDMLRLKGFQPKIETPVTVQASTDLQTAVESWDFDSSDQSYSDYLVDV